LSLLTVVNGNYERGWGIEKPNSSQKKIEVKDRERKGEKIIRYVFNEDAVIEVRG